MILVTKAFGRTVILLRRGGGLSRRLSSTYQDPRVGVILRENEYGRLKEAAGYVSIG